MNDEDDDEELITELRALFALSDAELIEAMIRKRVDWTSLFLTHLRDLGTPRDLAIADAIERGLKSQ
jgi:hypothetical protein